MPLPTTALVDTTVITDCLLKGGERAARAGTAIKRYTTSLLPEYAIMEFRAGPLYAYIWLHNKFVQQKGLAATIAAIAATARGFKKNLTSTALEAFATVASAEAAKPSVIAIEGTGAERDLIQAERYRLELKAIIFRAWRKRRRITTEVVHELACFPEEDIPETKGLIDWGTRLGCSQYEPCAMQKIILSGYAADARRLLASDAMSKDKPENSRRRKALNDLLRHPDRPQSVNSCRSLGDAIFALLAPAGSAILTTNVQDHAPLAAVLGKVVETP